MFPAIRPWPTTLVQSNELFDRWCGYMSNNKKVSPVELLVLGSLHYLGRGWTFDDCEESTAIDKEVHCCFFNVYMVWKYRALPKMGHNSSLFARGKVKHA